MLFLEGISPRQLENIWNIDSMYINGLGDFRFSIGRL